MFRIPNTNQLKTDTNSTRLTGPDPRRCHAEAPTMEREEPAFVHLLPPRLGVTGKEIIMYTRIVVPLDGSDLAEQALDTGSEMARLTGATLHLIRVVEFPASNFTYVYGGMIESEAISMRIEDERQIAAEYLEAVARPLKAQGITVTTDVLQGVAIQELVDAMQPGDLYVLASHGRSGVARWFLGSVAEEITRRSSVPVLLVRSKLAKNGRRSKNTASATM